MAQQEAQLREVPRNKLLGMIADALSAASSPQRTQQMQGMATFLGIPALATTANRMSYGEPLTTGKGMTTKMKPETADAVMSILENLPTPGKAAPAAAGIIFPAMAAGAKMSELKAARKLIDAGDLDAAYKQFGIYPDPVTRELLKVVPDTEARLKLDNLSYSLHNSSVGPRPPHEIRYKNFGRTPLADTLEHAQLYELMPEAANISLGKSVDYGGFLPDYPGLREAAYMPATSKVPEQIAIGQFLESLSPEKNALKDMTSALLHEVQHGIQTRYSMPLGGSTNQFIQNPARLDLAKQKLEELSKTGKYATGYAQDTLNGVEDKAYELYKYIPGEVQSRLVQRQYETGDYTTHPYEIMNSMGIDLERFKQGEQHGQLLDLNREVQNILNIYAP